MFGAAALMLLSSCSPDLAQVSGALAILSPNPAGDPRLPYALASILTADPYGPAPAHTRLAAAPFRGGEAGSAAAASCLSTAIYYEARSESVEGQRAVAQVVLNRVRHPAFPATVCGVVFEGSSRSTGCQFSFTCDGSMRAPRDMAAWRRAEAIAEAALAGHVERRVGLSTHYHRLDVDPYWAPTLERLATVGDHIFYNWKGEAGSLRALRTLPMAPAPKPPRLRLAALAPAAMPSGLRTEAPFELKAETVIAALPASPGFDLAGPAEDLLPAQD